MKYVHMEATTDSKPKFNRLLCQKRPDPKRLSKSGSAKFEKVRFRPDPDRQHCIFFYTFSDRVLDHERAHHPPHHLPHPARRVPLQRIRQVRPQIITISIFLAFAI
jgi:hypothetical protein